MSKEKKHFVYIVRCADGSLYTGYARDVIKRLSEHNGEGKTRTARTAGAHYTRSRRPVSLVYTESFPSRSEATRREVAVKKLTRSEKIKLINQGSFSNKEVRS